MTLRFGALLFGAAMMANAAVAPARAAEVSGLAASHDMRRESGRLCFLDHYHYGSSLGQPTKKKAELAAIGSWANFVDFEYGPTWARFARASSKGMKCSQSTSGWGCELNARPCR